MWQIIAATLCWKIYYLPWPLPQSDEQRTLTAHHATQTFSFIFISKKFSYVSQVNADLRGANGLQNNTTPRTITQRHPKSFWKATEFKSTTAKRFLNCKSEWTMYISVWQNVPSWPALCLTTLLHTIIVSTLTLARVDSTSSDVRRMFGFRNVSQSRSIQSRTGIRRMWQTHTQTHEQVGQRLLRVLLYRLKGSLFIGQISCEDKICQQNVTAIIIISCILKSKSWGSVNCI